MIYIYAIVDDPGGLRAETRECDAAPEPTAETVWEHERKVEELMERHAVLPARFGTTFEDREKLDACLARHRQELIRGLERVRDCVELGVRVMAEEAKVEVGAHASGRDYMTALAAAEMQVRDLRESVHGPLEKLARETVVKPGTGGELLLSAAYLVERGSVPAFRETVARLGEAHRDVQILCTGPWPAYNFVPRIDLAKETL